MTMIGRTVSHFRILEKLGEGGMGVVYRARDTNLERDVALKFLPAHVSATKETTARFLQEARAAAALNHANICTVYGVQEHDSSDGSRAMFIAMEYIDGGTLRGKLPLAGVSDAAAIALQVGEALQEAHSRGIVHRDIKADNIMLTSRGQVKVMDFGLAKLKGSLKLTRTSSTVGTLGYMAPEQISGGEVDARSDLFSFGVLIFEMLTGRLPFRGEHEAAMVYSIMNEQPEPLSKFMPDAPPELGYLIAKALEKDPADRYQSVGEMLVDLRRLKKSTTRVSRQYPLPPAPAAAAGTSSPSHVVPVGGSAVQPVSGSVAPSPGATRARRSKLIVVAGVAVLVLAGAAALVMMLRSGSRPITIADVAMSRVTSVGNAGYGTISPDGKYIVYVRGEPGEIGLWIRQVATGSEIVVIPPSDVVVRGSSFSNDGNYVYYTAVLKNAPVPSVYRTPVLGGAPPRKILENADGPVTLSPDDSRMAFLRSYPATGEEALFVANADGTGERKLASRDGKNLFYLSEGGAPAWSPDGSVIVSAAGTTIGDFVMNLVAIPVDDPRERIFTSMNWVDVGRIAWHPDGTGLLVCARATRESPHQMYYASYPGGEVSPVTNDLLSYGPSSLSITRDGSMIVSAQGQTNSSVMLVPEGDASRVVEITGGATAAEGLRGLAWLDNRRILHTSSVRRPTNFWLSSLEGGDPRQISQGEETEYDPAVSRVRGEIYYTSRGSALPCVWKMKLDGSGRTQVTFSEDYNPEVSPDGRWLLFDSWRSGSRSLWMLRLDGADTATMFRQGAVQGRFSPDGRHVVCEAHDPKENRSRPTILAFPSGETVAVFDFPTPDIPDYLWSPDGKTFHFRESRKGVDNLWSYDYRSGAAAQLTHFTSGDIFNFAWSPDGKNLAVARGSQTSDLVLLTVRR